MVTDKSCSTHVELHAPSSSSQSLLPTSHSWSLEAEASLVPSPLTVLAELVDLSLRDMVGFAKLLARR